MAIYRRSSRPNESEIAGYTDVTKPCVENDEINSCFQEPLSLKLFKSIVFTLRCF